VRDGRTRCHNGLRQIVEIFVRQTLPLLAFLAVVAAVGPAQAANMVDPTLIPDGTYNATVEKVMDGKHITIKLDNGVETTVTTNRTNVDFGKVHPNDKIMMSLIKGMVAVYKVLST
jgi:translation initiation factor IF-1